MSKNTKAPAKPTAKAKTAAPKSAAAKPAASTAVRAEDVPELQPFLQLFNDAMGQKAMRGELDQEDRDAISRVYTRLFRSPVPRTCSNCMSDAFFEIYNVLKSRSQEFLQLYNCRYRLVGGAVLDIFGDSRWTATNKNLTDELAERHLRDNPQKARFFEALPDDWMQRLKK